MKMATEGKDMFSVLKKTEERDQRCNHTSSGRSRRIQSFTSFCQASDPQIETLDEYKDDIFTMDSMPLLPKREGQAMNMKNQHSELVKKVFIKCVFLKIEDINTIQETFSGLCFVRARWREKSLDGQRAKDPSSIDWDKLWGPKLDINNILGEAKVQKWRDLQFTDSGECFVLEKRRVKGTFTEKMELEEFPFDIQDLSLLITSEHTLDEIDLSEDLEDISNVVTHSFVDESEWHLKKFVQCEPRITENEFTQNKYRKPGLFFRCCVIRRAGFFMWNIMLVMSIISALSFVTFAVERTLPQNRIQLSFILLLAGVTFKFAASQSVPKISYLTHLDRYILGSMVFLFMVAVYHGVITRVSDSDLSFTIDQWVFVGFICLYVLLHLIFLLVMLIRGHTRRKDVHLREQEYLNRLASVKEKDNPKQSKLKTLLLPTKRGSSTKVGSNA